MRYDVKSFAKEVVKELETVFFGVIHEAFAGAISTMIHDLALTTADGNASQYRYEKQRQYCNNGDSDINSVGAKYLLN